MIKASGSFFIGHDDRRFEKKGLVHGSRLLLQSVPRTQRRSRFVGVVAWCGAEHKRDPRLDCIVETRSAVTCLRCVVRQFAR